MTCHAAARCDNRLRGNHAVKIVGTSFDAHEHDLVTFLGHLFGFIWRKDDLSLGGARTCGQSGRENLSGGIRIDCRMQQLIELFRRDASHRSCAIDQFLARHVNRDAHGGGAGAFAGARLQHPELAALDRELAVLHVMIMLFQQLRDRIELLINFRQFLFQLADRIRSARAGDDILALRVQEVLAV